MLNGLLSDRRLENGLRLLCHNVPDSPLAVVTLLYRVGSRHERVGERGYAHLFEHLMFDGSRSLGRGDYDRYCTMAGGENNAWTSTDLTSYWIALPSEALELGLWLEADRMAGFGVEEISLRTQLSVVEAERRQVIENQPYGGAGSHIRRLLYSETHPYRHEPIGLREDLAGATLGSLRSFFTRFYHPGNATLVVAGDLSTDGMASLVEKHFGSIPSGNLPTEPATGEREPEGRIEVVDSEVTPLNGAFLAWHASDVRDEELRPLELLSMILADGDSSRLSIALEYDRSLTSETGAWIEEGELGSIFHLYGLVRENSTTPADLHDALIAEVRRLVRDGIEPRELRKALNRKQSGLVSSLASISNRAERLAWYATIFDDPGLVWNEVKEYENVSTDMIIAAAERLLQTDPSALHYPAADTSGAE